MKKVFFEITIVLQGSLMPSFWVQMNDGSKKFIKAVVTNENNKLSKFGGTVTLNFDDLATGKLDIVSNILYQFKIKTN